MHAIHKRRGNAAAAVIQLKNPRAEGVSAPSGAPSAALDPLSKRRVFNDGAVQVHYFFFLK